MIRSRVIAIAATTLVLNTIVSHGDDLTEVDPAEHGFSSERLAKIRAYMAAFVDAGELAGSIPMIARNGQVVLKDIRGVVEIRKDEPLREDQLFRIHSMTKPIAAVAALMLLEEGKFTLNDPLAKFVPEVAAMKLPNGEAVGNGIRMHHVMTHTAGFGSTQALPGASAVDQQWADAELFTSNDLDEFARRLAELPLRSVPGTEWFYGVSSDVQGLVVERIAGQSFADFLQTRLFDPLEMNDTFFEAPDDKRDRLGPNHRWDAENRRLVIHEPSPTDVDWEDVTLFSGGGGLLSTTSDYFRFAEMLRQRGSLDGVQILSPRTVDLMTQNHLPLIFQVAEHDPRAFISAAGPFWTKGIGYGLGVGPITQSFSLRTPGSFRWGGLSSTVFWVDPVEELTVILMAQRVPPWAPVRDPLIEMTYGALTESYAEQH